jgi:hypothetical protein
MASPLRLWSPSRPGASRRGRPCGGGTAAARRAGVVESLEARQLFAASLVSLDTTELSSGNNDSLDPT